jgi:hypothetical protein
VESCCVAVKKNNNRRLLSHVMQIHCGPSSLAREAYSTSAIAGGPEMLNTLQPNPSK